MKKLTLLLSFISLSLQFATAQSVNVTGPSSLEVGIAANFTATFNPSGLPAGHTAEITKVKWEAPFIGANAGAIPGKVNNVNAEVVEITTTSTSSTIPILWGDFFGNPDGIVRATFFYNQKDADGNQVGVEQNKFDDANVTIKIVCIPVLNAPANIHKCCTSPLNITASACDANYFTWTVTGATINSGGNSNTINITPSTQTTITITCVARRSQGLTSYSRSKTITISRPNPPTPTVSASNYYFCIGQAKTVTLSGASTCGLTNTQWSYPAYLTVTGQGTNTITVTANSNAPVGGTANISAILSYSGGCSVTTPVKSFAVYSSAAPPTPVGTVYVEPDNPNDLCNTDWLIYFNATNPYNNGLTIVSPGIMLNHRTTPLKVTVCYRNLCSNTQSCIYQWIDPPYPCNDPLIAAPENEIALTSDNELTLDDKTNLSIDNDVIEITFDEASEDQSKTSNLVQIIPNPASQFFTILLSESNSGSYELINTSGIMVSRGDFIDSQSVFVGLEQSLSPGFYIVKLNIGGALSFHRIVIQ